jgi:hypothetical protein
LAQTGVFTDGQDDFNHLVGLVKIQVIAREGRPQRPPLVLMKVGLEMLLPEARFSP